MVRSARPSGTKLPLAALKGRLVSLRVAKSAGVSSAQSVRSKFSHGSRLGSRPNIGSAPPEVELDVEEALVDVELEPVELEDVLVGVEPELVEVEPVEDELDDELIGSKRLQPLIITSVTLLNAF